MLAEWALSIVVSIIKERATSRNAADTELQSFLSLEER